MENPWFEEVEASSNFVKIAAKNVQSDNGQTQMRETITVECQKLNGRVFNGQFQWSKGQDIAKIYSYNHATCNIYIVPKLYLVTNVIYRRFLCRYRISLPFITNMSK